MLKLKGHLKIEQLKESLYDMLFEWSKKNLFVKHFQLVSMNEWKRNFFKYRISVMKSGTSTDSVQYKL